MEPPEIKKKKIETKIKNPEKIKQRYQQIVDGAVKVFAGKGFHSSTVKEIADAAGITEGTLYNYIRCKEDIIYIVYEYTTHILREQLRNAVNSAGSPKERLETALLENMNSIDRNQDIILFLYKESASLDKESLHTVLAKETKYIEMFEDLLREYFGSQNAEEEKIRLAADLLTYVPIIVAFRRWSLKRRFDSMETVTKGILDFLMHAIRFVIEGDNLSDREKAAYEKTN